MRDLSVHLVPYWTILIGLDDGDVRYVGKYETKEEAESACYGVNTSLRFYDKAENACVIKVGGE